MFCLSGAVNSIMNYKILSDQTSVSIQNNLAKFHEDFQQNITELKIKIKETLVKIELIKNQQTEAKNQSINSLYEIENSLINTNLIVILIFYFDKTLI